MEFGLQVPHVIRGVLHSFRGPNSNHMEASVRLRTSAKKKTPRSHWLIQDGKWGVLMEKDNKHTRVEVTTWTEHKYTSTCIPTRGPWKAYLRPAKAVRLT